MLEQLAQPAKEQNHFNNRLVSCQQAKRWEPSFRHHSKICRLQIFSPTKFMSVSWSRGMNFVECLQDDSQHAARSRMLRSWRDVSNPRRHAARYICRIKFKQEPFGQNFGLQTLRWRGKRRGAVNGTQHRFVK